MCSNTRPTSKRQRSAWSKISSFSPPIRTQNTQAVRSRSFGEAVASAARTFGSNAVDTCRGWSIAHRETWTRLYARPGIFSVAPARRAASKKSSFRTVIRLGLPMGQPARAPEGRGLGVGPVQPRQEMSRDPCRVRVLEERQITDQDHATLQSGDRFRSRHAVEVGSGTAR